MILYGITFLADLGFDNWTPWSSCSQTCEGVRKRGRECLGLKCDGDAEEVESCGTPQCPSKSTSMQNTVESLKNGYHRCKSSCPSYRLEISAIKRLRFIKMSALYHVCLREIYDIMHNMSFIYNN